MLNFYLSLKPHKTDEVYLFPPKKINDKTFHFFVTAGEFSKFYLLDVTQGMVAIESNQVTSLEKTAI